MTQHLHNTHVPGCYRCDLREDEARDHQAAEWERPAQAIPADGDALAQYIAAANPATILRLIKELRLYKVPHAECEADAQRAAETRLSLEARLAAVEALAKRWETHPTLDGRPGAQEVITGLVHQLREALTDTTKETP